MANRCLVAIARRLLPLCFPEKQLIFLDEMGAGVFNLSLDYAPKGQLLQKAQARTKESLYLALAQALNTLTPEHAKVYFGHVGIRV